MELADKSGKSPVAAYLKSQLAEILPRIFFFLIEWDPPTTRGIASLFKDYWTAFNDNLILKVITITEMARLTSNQMFDSYVLAKLT